MRQLLLIFIVFFFCFQEVGAAGNIVDGDLARYPVQGANETYGSGWDNDTTVSEKDDIYDYLHQLDTDDDGDVDNVDASVGSAPSAATYITQVPDSGLYNEQALNGTSDGGLEHASGVISSFSLTAAGKALLDDANASVQRVTLELNKTTNATASGAYYLGIFDEFGNSASSNAQAVLNDLDAALDLRCLESVFGISLSSRLSLNGTALDVSSVLEKYHAIDPSSDVQTMLGSANNTVIRSNIGTEIGVDAQAYESTLTDIADGTINENLVNEAHPWADNETSNTLTLDLLQLSILTSAPSSPAAGRIYFVDNDTYDPCDVVGTDNYYCIYDGAAYIAIMDEDGTFFISSIELPSFSHFATGDAAYSDNATPHVLTLEEMKGSIITNAGASQDKVYTCQAAAFGVNFMMMVITAYQVDLEPASGETLWLNGTQMAADEHIQNTADTKGDIMSCWSVESGDGTYEIFCKSDNANWVEATP